MAQLAQSETRGTFKTVERSGLSLQASHRPSNLSQPENQSCVGEATCLNIDADIGSGSCRENPYNCEGFVGKIGDNR